MTWGTGGWGTTPWGGGAPSVLGDVHITTVTFLSTTYLRIHLNTQVVASGSYLDPSNYTITVRNDTPVPGDAVNVVRVFTPTQDVVIADFIYLETTRHTNGATYDVSFTTLQTLDGVASPSSTAAYTSRTTKLMSSLRAIPDHFDRRLDALLHAVVAAIATQDDQIGGSRSDEYP